MRAQVLELIKDNKLKVKVYPGAKKTCFKDIREGIIRIDIKAQPEDGKANTELLKFLKKELKLAFEIKVGKTSRNKNLEVI